MTYEQYWDQDPELAVFYRKSAEIRTDRKNQELWLQGMYIYDALCCASPILRSFGKKGTKPLPYPTAPYPISQKQQEKAHERKEKHAFNKGKARMDAYMKAMNAKFKPSPTDNIPHEIERSEANVYDN